jgi:hypothetical protein
MLSGAHPKPQKVTIMKLHAVGPGVDEATFDIGVDQAISRTDVAPAIAVMEPRRGKLEQIDRFTFHDVFHER